MRLPLIFGFLLTVSALSFAATPSALADDGDGEIDEDFDLVCIDGGDEIVCLPGPDFITACRRDGRLDFGAPATRTTQST